MKDINIDEILFSDKLKELDLFLRDLTNSNPVEAIQILALIIVHISAKGQKKGIEFALYQIEELRGALELLNHEDTDESIN